jgi:hypothetical protein
MVTVMEAGLEYPDGKEAMIDTGAWLHHLMVVNRGKGLSDPTCSHALFSFGERMFAAGNERSPIWMTDRNGSLKSGYHLKTDSALSMVLELMNLDNVPKEVYLTISYEYLPGPPQEGWLNTKPVYLDVTGCGKNSEAPAPEGKSQFVLDSKEFRAPWNGELVWVMGHLHDGGELLEVHQRPANSTENKVVCDARAKYGENPSYVERSSNGTAGMKHISSMSNCGMTGKIQTGDKLSISAHYDLTKNMPMYNAKGKPAAVMGTGFMYVATPFT